MVDRTIVLAQNKRHGLRGLTQVTPQEFVAYHEDNDALTYVVDMAAYLDGETITNVTRVSTGVVISNASNTSTRLIQRLSSFGSVEFKVTTSAGDVEQFRLSILQRLEGKAQGGVSSNMASEVQSFDSAQSVAGVSVHSSINHIRTAGYYSNGDGGDALYKRWAGTSPPTTGAGTAYITSNNGSAIWELIADTEINVLSLGAHRNGTNATITTAAVNNAIAFLPNPDVSWGGGIVFIPAGNYACNATIAVNKSYVTLQGAGTQATRLVFSNMASADWIKVGTSPSGAATRRQCVRDLMLNAGGNNSVTHNTGATVSGGVQPGEVAGASLKAVNTYDALFERLSIENTLCGIDIGETTNNISVSNVTIIPNQSGSVAGINWHCPNDNSYRSDLIFLNNVVINGQYGGASTVGILMTGFTHTITGNAIRILQVSKGWVVSNPTTTAYEPNFINVCDVQIEGCKTRSLEITHGREFKFVNFDILNQSGTGAQGSADNDCVFIQGNASRQVQNVIFTNGTLGLCRQKGINLEYTRDVKLGDVIFRSCAQAGSGSHPAILVGGSTVGTAIKSVVAEEQGGVLFTSYGVQVNTGAQRVIIEGLDASRCVTGAINDGAAYGAVIAANILGPTTNDALMKVPANNVDFGAADANNTIVNIGRGASGNKFSLVDFIADTTYTDYGFRVGRKNDGANGTSTLEHRGTGVLAINAADAGVVDLATTNTARLRVKAAGGFLIYDGNDFELGTTNGTKIGTATSQRFAFYNATPVPQRSGAAQVAVATTAATNTTPWGFSTQAQADGVITLLNEVRASLVSLGLIKGSA
jgi:hypothetical protein